MDYLNHHASPSLSRSTWACELKCCQQGGISDHCMSRSTWACELKSPIYWQFNYTWLVTLHVSVWVEIFGIYISLSKNSSRSTWACELKFADHFIGNFIQSHAPRERVSWNRTVRRHTYVVLRVTLHVSVWVEMLQRSLHSRCFLSRSTWACELKCCQQGGISDHCMSRSTWACELKSPIYWQFNYTWLVTLHVSVWVEIFGIYISLSKNSSRSTWACELKFADHFIGNFIQSHAPRERVSWNRTVRRHTYVVLRVTLHVSVWVEIWDLTICSHFPPVTLHVSVWVEICFRRRKKRTFQVTLHVSVWVEIIHSANLGKSARVTLHVSVWVEMLLLD